jgi:small conductance mechanosensitive channel
MENTFDMAREMLAFYGLKVVAAIAILIIGRMVAGWIRGLIRKMMEKAGTDPMLVSFVGNLTYFALLAFVVIAALNQLGIQTTSFIAILGAAGLAIGLALQGSLQNFAAGVLIIIFRPYKVGDFIEGGGTTGVIEAMDIFTTRMKTGDNKTVIVPNAGILGGNITNYSAKPTRRVDLVIGVGYGDDLAKVKAVLKDVLDADPRIHADPAPTVGVVELADNSVNLVVRPWVDSGDYWPVHFDLLETIKNRFDAEGISIPYPQSDVHLHTVSGEAA